MNKIYLVAVTGLHDMDEFVQSQLILAVSESLFRMPVFHIRMLVFQFYVISVVEYDLFIHVHTWIFKVVLSPLLFRITSQPMVSTRREIARGEVIQKAVLLVD